ncbi:U-box domain-containing protein 27 [Hibiscus syriacus]|uniref:U-box domain-containing protein n=1 Tax=Hibiscus syriacus TaxID=106335 RepID=A0A6A3CHJ4_HIBSY|nr:U-box domain-containing protein 27-like [Hibiscus syriacus]KAE8728246.1 U-box domain-containing protein 27 [Hibiscus syriacus]
MPRHDLYITVPNLFRCPISLDVMTSPMSLCTGVTYDRTSIQRWLDSGNNTCPATMQVLQTKDFVPNRNLQRLIQIWSNSVACRQLHAESVVVPSQDQVKILVKQLDNGCISALTKIVCFARESEENREFLARMDGFLNAVYDFMRNAEADIKLIEQVVQILDLMINKYLDKKKPLLESNCLSTIHLVLQIGSSDSKIQSVRLLESLAVDGESKLKIAEKEGLLVELVKSLTKDNDPRLIEASLSCLIAIATRKRVKTKVIQSGTIPELKILLSEPNMTTVSMIEKSLKLLETLSSCKEGSVEIRHDSILLQAIVQRVLKVSSKATEHAVTILWMVCYLFREEEAVEAVVSGNGMTKILLLIQSNCSPAVRQMSADLLKIFGGNSKPCLSSYDTKTTHIMPF